MQSLVSQDAAWSSRYSRYKYASDDSVGHTFHCHIPFHIRPMLSSQLPLTFFRNRHPTQSPAPSSKLTYKPDDIDGISTTLGNCHLHVTSKPRLNNLHPRRLDPPNLHHMPVCISQERSPSQREPLVASVKSCMDLRHWKRCLRRTENGTFQAMRRMHGLRRRRVGKESSLTGCETIDGTYMLHKSYRSKRWFSWFAGAPETSEYLRRRFGIPRCWHGDWVWDGYCYQHQPVLISFHYHLMDFMILAQLPIPIHHHSISLPLGKQT